MPDVRKRVMMELLIKLLAIEIWFCTVAILYYIRDNLQRDVIPEEGLTSARIVDISLVFATIAFWVILWAA